MQHQDGTFALDEEREYRRHQSDSNTMVIRLAGYLQEQSIPCLAAEYLTRCIFLGPLVTCRRFRMRKNVHA